MSATRRQFLRDLSSGGAGLVLAGQASSFAGRRAGEERQIDGIRLCWCPAGSFEMGSPLTEPDRRPDEGPVVVRLTRGFFAGKFEVTQGQWRRVMGDFPGRLPGERFGLGDDVPAYWITFDDAERFALEATRRAHSSGSLPAAWRFSLPTEAQWEYACRAGTTSPWAIGDVLTPRLANFSETPPVRAADAVGGAARVGQYPANAWGLHDMHGNVWEWCRDWYHAALTGGSDPDRSSVPGTPNRDGSHSRVRRGGAWIESAAYCRSASRLPYEPHRGSDHIGFRVFVIEE